MRVVCLEQGHWQDPTTYPGAGPDWELQARKQWASSPNVRGGPADYPIDLERGPTWPRELQRSRRWHRALQRSVAAPPPFELPHGLGARRRRRLAALVRGAAALLRGDRPAVRRLGPRRQPGVPARRRSPATAPAHRAHRARARPRPRTPRMALVAGVQRDRSPPSTTAVTSACNAASCGSGCNEGAKASTDVTPLAASRSAPAPASSPVRAFASSRSTGAAARGRDLARRRRRRALPARRRRAVRGERSRHRPTAAAVGARGRTRRSRELLGTRRATSDGASRSPRRRLLRRRSRELPRALRRPDPVARVRRHRSWAWLRRRDEVEPRSDRRPARRRVRPARPTRPRCRPPRHMR